jgi:thioredoxin 1
VQFFKVDTDEAREVANKCGIRAVPTFQVFKAEKMFEEMVGANEKRRGLMALITKNK